jgi:hypothetical protein
MSRVIVHIGHGKTGSSFLQSKFAQNAAYLDDLGILYPHHKSSDTAKSGGITSGNGELLLAEEYKIPSSEVATLYSDERLFWRLVEKKAVMRLVEKVVSQGSELTVFVYTRDLFEHSVSSWGQYIKRGKGVRGYNDFMRNTYGDVFEFLQRWIIAAKELQFQLKICNYSRHKEKLFSHFMSEIVDSEVDSFESGGSHNPIVNRSLTMAEYELQRLFNTHYRKNSAQFISDKLVNELPMIRSEKPSIKLATYQAVVKKLSPIISDINLNLDSNEKIMIQDYDDLNKDVDMDNCDSLSFSKIQLEVFTRSISSKMNLLHANSDKLKPFNASAGSLRDMAIKIERGEQLDLNDAHTLMLLAQRSRPSGPLINQKVKEYASRLHKNMTPE